MRIGRTQVLVGVASVVIIGGGFGIYYGYIHKPPPVAAVAKPETPTLRPARPQGPVIHIDEAMDKGKKVAQRPTKPESKAAPKPVVEKIVGVGPERKLPSKGEKRHLTMYANLQVVTPTLYRIDVASGSNGVKEPGKGYFKIKPTVVRDKARPFIETEGVWMSENPPIYFIRPRDHQTSLPMEFTVVYVRNGVYYPVDLTRSFINGRDDVVVKKVPGDRDNVYVALPQGKK